MRDQVLEHFPILNKTLLFLMKFIKQSVLFLIESLSFS